MFSVVGSETLSDHNVRHDPSRGVLVPMPDPYVAEAPPPRVRPTDTINSKLDRIIDMVSGRSSESTDTNDAEDESTVTFEADPEGLPESATLTDENEGENPTDEGAGTGEGTHNVASAPEHARFRHPAAPRRAVTFETD